MLTVQTDQRAWLWVDRRRSYDDPTSSRQPVLAVHQPRAAVASEVTIKAKFETGGPAVNVCRQRRS